MNTFSKYEYFPLIHFLLTYQEQKVRDEIPAVGKGGGQCEGIEDGTVDLKDKNLLHSHRDERETWVSLSVSRLPLNCNYIKIWTEEKKIPVNCNMIKPCLWWRWCCMHKNEEASCKIKENHQCDQFHPAVSWGGGCNEEHLDIDMIKIRFKQAFTALH